MHPPLSRADLARDLLRIGAVAFRPDRPFTWASGRRSPVYTDNRLTLAHPDIRARIAGGFATMAGGLGADAVAGTATAGIPHAALLADRLGLPLAYVRSAPKGHGKQNRVEGRVEPGQRVLVVEDLVSTGGSVLSAAEALREAGAEPAAAFAVFSYGFEEAGRAFAEAGLPLQTLTDFDTLASVAEHDGSISGADLRALHDWRRDPAAWSEAWLAREAG